MNSANNSLKTIAATITVSVLLFGVFYYLISDISKEPDLSSSYKKETVNTKKENAVALSRSNEKIEKIEKSENQKPSDVVLGASTEKTSGNVFGALAKSKITPVAANGKPVVLAGSDVRDSTESSVPNTGSEALFAAFVISSVITLVGIYMLVAGPRNMALANFEKKITKEIE